MKISSTDLFSEFYEQESKNYPKLSSIVMRDICFMPWEYVKKVMESGTLSPIRLKYFGTFLVYRGRVGYILKELKEKFNKQECDPKLYFRMKKSIEDYLERTSDGKI